MARLVDVVIASQPMQFSDLLDDDEQADDTEGFENAEKEEQQDPPEKANRLAAIVAKAQTVSAMIAHASRKMATTLKAPVLGQILPSNPKHDPTSLVRRFEKAMEDLGLIGPQDWHDIITSSCFIDDYPRLELLLNAQTPGLLSPKNLDMDVFNPIKGCKYLPDVVYLWGVAVTPEEAMRVYKTLNNTLCWKSLACSTALERLRHLAEAGETSYLTYVGQTSVSSDSRLRNTVSLAHRSGYGPWSKSSVPQFAGLVLLALFDPQANDFEYFKRQIKKRVVKTIIARSSNHAYLDYLEIGFIHALGCLNMDIGGKLPYFKGYGCWQQLLVGVPDLSSSYFLLADSPPNVSVFKNSQETLIRRLSYFAQRSGGSVAAHLQIMAAWVAFLRIEQSWTSGHSRFGLRNGGHSKDEDASNPDGQVNPWYPIVFQRQ